MKLQKSRCTIPEFESIAYVTLPDLNTTNNFARTQKEKYLNTNEISKSVDNKITNTDNPINMRREYQTLITKYNELRKENEMLKYVLLDFEEDSEKIRQEISK